MHQYQQLIRECSNCQYIEPPAQIELSHHRVGYCGRRNAVAIWKFFCNRVQPALSDASRSISTRTRVFNVSVMMNWMALSQFQSDYPNCGQQLILGHLRDKGISVQRYRLRESIARTDPLRRLVRWHQVVSRRTYSVNKSNSLWHIDGYHSLIRWRNDVRGGIDGYSRMITYLSGSTNNRALTVYRLFRSATEDYGVPSRVRSDKGGENVLVYVIIPGIRPHSRFICKESNGCGGMFIVAYALYTMSSSAQWKQVVSLSLTVNWTSLFFTVFFCQG